MKVNEVYVRVSAEGVLSRASRMSMTEAYDANFIVEKTSDGTLVVRKDRYGSFDVEITKAEADARAHDHVEVALGRKSSRSIARFG